MPKSSVDRYKDSDNRRQFLRFWGACVQSALPLKSSRTDDAYKGRLRHLVWDFPIRGIKTGAKAFVLTPGAEISMEQGPVSFHYNQLTECPWICIRKDEALPGTLITVIFNDNTADASLVPVTVQ